MVRRSNIFSTQFKDLCLDLQNEALSPVHAKAIYKMVFKQLLNEIPLNASKINQQLPARLSQVYPAAFFTAPLSISQIKESKYDASVKMLLTLNADSRQIEAVLMPEKNRLTLCVSSQVGCAQGCVFCATGRMGLIRHLAVDEIVGQLWIVQRWMHDHPEWVQKVGMSHRPVVSNIVFMGMGEPLDNVGAVCEAIDIWTSPAGFAMGPRQITVSTAGHVDGLRELMRLHPRVKIALSLHSPFDSERSKIMPINRTWGLDQLFLTIREGSWDRKNSILVQYTLIQGVNDSQKHAEGLIQLLEKIPNAKVNIIPLNEITSGRLRSPDVDKVADFKNRLHHAGIRVMVRYSKGQDISGACGQLVV